MNGKSKMPKQWWDIIPPKKKKTAPSGGTALLEQGISQRAPLSALGVLPPKAFEPVKEEKRVLPTPTVPLVKTERVVEKLFKPTPAEALKPVVKPIESPLETIARTTPAFVQPRQITDIRSGMVVFGQGLLRLPEQLAAKTISALRGRKGASVVNKDWGSKMIETARVNQEEFVSLITKAYGDKKFLPGIEITDVAQMPENLAFSGLSMGAGLSSGGLTALLPIPGARVAAWGVGTATAGKVAFEMASYDIMQEYLEFKDAEKKAENLFLTHLPGKGITLEEENKLKKEFDSLAVKHGLWEAIPEAIGGAVGFGILLKPLTKMVGRVAAVQILSKLVSVYGEELVTETITELGQTQIRKEAGLPDGRDVNWNDPKDWLLAMKSVAPQTFLLTTVLVGAGSTAIKTQEALDTLKLEVKETDPLFDKFVAKINELAPIGLTIKEVGEGPDVEPTKEKISESIKEKLEEIESEVWIELDTAEAGRRFVEDPEFQQIEGYKVTGVPSSFPSWIPEHLRLRPLLDKVKDHMTEGTRPTKGTRIMELYNIVRGEITNRYSEARTEILSEAGLSEKDVWVQELGLPEPDITKPKGTDYKIKIDIEKVRRALVKSAKTLPKTKIKKSIREVTEQVKPELRAFTDRIRDLVRGMREGRITTKQEIEVTQTELLDILDRSRLELSDKAKFRRAIKNVQTQEQLAKVLPDFQSRITALEEKATKRTVKKKIIKELKQTRIRKQAGKPVGKFTPEIQRTLNQLRSASRIKKSEAETIINANLQKYKDSIPPESVALENKILSMIAGMDEMATKDLQDTLKQIQSIKETGRLTVELAKFNREAEIDQWNDKAIDIITGGKGLPENISTIGTARLRPKELRARVKNFMGTIGKSFVGWNDIIDMLARKTKAKPGTTWLDDFADVTTETNAVKKGNRTNTEQAQEMAQDTLGVKTDREMVKRFRDDAKEVSLGTFENTEGVETEIIFTKSEARKKWMELQDPTLEESFRLGMFYTDEIIQSIEDFLTPEDIAFAKRQMNFYNSYYDGVNEVYGDIYGVDLPQNEQYSPIKREGIARDESAGFGEFLQEMSVRKAVTSGSLKSRVRNIKPLQKQSDVATLEQHIAEMEHFKSWAQKVRDLRAVFGNPRTRTAIIREHGKGMLAMVDNFLNDFTRGGVELASRLSWLDKIRGNFSRAVLGIKPSIGIKQLTSFIAYADVIPVADFGKGVIDFWRNPMQNIKTLKESEMMKVRGKFMERDIRTAMRSDAYASFRKKPSFLNSLMLNIQIGDQGAIYVGGWSVYKYNLKQGKSHAEALRTFEKVTSNTQQSADLDKLSYWQRGGSFAKLFTMFKSAPNQFFRKELGAIRNVVHRRISAKQAAKTILIFHFLLPMFFQWVSDWFRWDPDEQKRAAILGPFNGIFIVGEGLDYLIRLGLDMKTWDAEIPLYSISDDIGKSVKLIGDDDITTEDIFNAIRGLLGATGAITGKPLKQVVDMGSGVKDVLFGEYGKGLGKFLGWSPYAVEEKKSKKEEKQWWEETPPKKK